MAENKEIDIIGLIIWMFDFFRRYIIVLLAFIVIGVGMGFLQFFLVRNYYNTTLIASSPVINNQIVYELIDPVKYYLRHEMYDSISVKFDISEDIARDIRKIELDTSLSSAVKIDLQIYNNTNIDAIQSGLMNYLNNIPYIVSNIENRRKELGDFIEELNLEIADLSKLQKAVLKNVQTGESESYISIGNMYSEMMSLNDRKLELLAEYNSLEYFKIINTNIVLESEKSVKKSIIIFTVLGLLLGFIFSMLLEVFRLIKIRKQKLNIELSKE